MAKGKSIAVVVPCYNEEDGVDRLIQELGRVREKLSGNQIDILLVNDGSSDDTQAVIEKNAAHHDYVFFRSLAQNAGHQTALRAGIDACGDYDAVIMMDADLQHPPSLIPKMIEAWEGGAQIVQMVRDDSAGEVGLGKFVTSKLYYKFINSISSLSMEYGASDFRLIDKSVTRMVIGSNEQDLFLRGYFSWLPVKKVSIPYKPAARFAGKSKYTFKKMLNLASSGVMQFSEKPLRLAMNIGITLALASFIYGIVIIVGHLMGSYTVSGWTSLMVVLLFCFGVNFILLGIIGRYLALGVQLIKARPEYVVAVEKVRNVEAQEFR